MSDKQYYIRTSYGVFLFVFVLFFIRYFNISYPLAITTKNESGDFSVVGEGKITIVPDTAYVDVGISVDNATSVEVAQNEIDKKNNDILKAIAKLGINKKDITTSNYSIYPNRAYDNGKNTVSGYNGNVTITIKTSTIALVSQIVTDVTKAGANQIQGTRYTVDKPEIYREKAREKAIANAKEQAAKISSSIGLRLGRITNIIEQPAINSAPYLMDAKIAMGGMGGAPAPDIEPGNQTISSTVTLFFEKK